MRAVNLYVRYIADAILNSKPNQVAAKSDSEFVEVSGDKAAE
jgi:hypothetical protein